MTFLAVARRVHRGLHLLDVATDLLPRIWRWLPLHHRRTGSSAQWRLTFLSAGGCWSSRRWVVQYSKDLCCFPMLRWMQDAKARGGEERFPSPLLMGTHPAGSASPHRPSLAPGCHRCRPLRGIPPSIHVCLPQRSRRLIWGRPAPEGHKPLIQPLHH